MAKIIINKNTIVTTMLGVYEPKEQKMKVLLSNLPSKIEDLDKEINGTTDLKEIVKAAAVNTATGTKRFILSLVYSRDKNYVRQAKVVWLKKHYHHGEPLTVETWTNGMPVYFEDGAEKPSQILYTKSLAERIRALHMDLTKDGELWADPLASANDLQ